MNLFDLTGKKAMVTGAGGDLGGGMAEGLLEAGAEVVLIDVSDRAIDVAKEFTRRGFVCSAVVGDLSTRAGVETIFEESLVRLGGRVDILINAAGIQRRHPSELFPIEDWEIVIAVNLTAIFSMCQLAARVMLENGCGKIINIASALSFFGGITVPAYAASKGGVAQLTKALANEWAKRGLNVNAIAPGYMDTQMNVKLVNDPTRNEEILARIPAGRWGKPADMKGLAIFLSSAASDYMNGAVIPCDGGYLGR